MMTEPPRQPTIDQAMGEFCALLNERPDDLDDAPPGDCRPPQTPEEAEAACFRMAEHLIRLVCPDPAACADQRCRRDGLCRYLVHLRDRQSANKSVHPRRTPGAEALRHAIWLYMSSRPDETGRGGS
jgi:hypothetical protein